MPKREDIKSILIIGSGPIVIGQACEFDYSGAQACKALKEEGYRVVLVNSNPATIMTDPALADRTYIEPLDPPTLESIILKEKPDAILPTMGGQTALNLMMDLQKRGFFDKHKVELIGASLEAIHTAEDRDAFYEAMKEVGVAQAKSGMARTVKQAEDLVDTLGFPVILRPSFTLGGSGGGIAYHIDDLRAKVARAIELSPVGSVLLEESLLGWKEYELEVMRDKKDNVVIICSIENFDPMGVHTGDSITVAPAQTLTDAQYQDLRDQSLRAMRRIGVDTGGSNVQFGVDPRTGRTVIIEINPRVSRSSALASKATGFPIAKIAAKLAIGYTLDEIPNDITKVTPASFEPAIDYVVTKFPRFAFEKFVGTPAILDTQMRSVGEAMALGRTFKESLQKGLRSLEIGRSGFEWDTDYAKKLDEEDLERSLATPNPGRVFYIKLAFERGWTLRQVQELTQIDPWFLHELKQLVDFEKVLRYKRNDPATLREAKRLGFSDVQIGRFWRQPAAKVRVFRKKHGIVPSFKLVDTCAAEFASSTPYYYSTYDDEDEVEVSRKKRKVVILGGGPNRIGQGIEFDYCCVHATQGLRELGYETVMVNCNPETVSTDYDTPDRLYFEPLTMEHVLDIIDKEKPEGVIVQFGGQTPLNLAMKLHKAGVKILGTPATSIDLAEDRKRFAKIVDKLRIPMPAGGTAISFEEARKVAKRVSYPVMVRPSYVLGGRAMEVVYDEDGLQNYIGHARQISPDHPILIDKFLDGAIEVDVDAVSDGTDVYIGGILEQLEEAGIHSGDSSCSLPPHSLRPTHISMIMAYTKRLAKALKVKGLLNIQFAVHENTVFLLEANPRASRTVPFVCKATSLPFAQIAAKVMVGRKLKAILPKTLWEYPTPPIPYTAVKESIFPFLKFPGVDPRLGPEMRSTGEVMGLGADFGYALAKGEEASGSELPVDGGVFLSVKQDDKRELLPIARQLDHWGFTIHATKHTSEYLKENGVKVQRVFKIGEGKPDIVDLLKQNTINLVVNTPSGKRSRSDGYMIRRTSLELGIPQITSIESARAAIHAMEALRERKGHAVKSLQEYYQELPY